MYFRREDAWHIKHRDRHAGDLKDRRGGDIRRGAPVGLQHLVSPSLQISLDGSALSSKVVGDKFGILRVSGGSRQLELRDPERGVCLQLDPIDRRVKL